MFGIVSSFYCFKSLFGLLFLARVARQSYYTLRELLHQKISLPFTFKRYPFPLPSCMTEVYFVLRKNVTYHGKSFPSPTSISPPYSYSFVFEFKIIEFTDSWQLNRVSLSDNESCIKDTRAPVHRNWYVPCTDLEALVNDQRPFKAATAAILYSRMGDVNP